ncbi:hypothetical protein Tco_1554414 [Tanacetum coccineum]
MIKNGGNGSFRVVFPLVRLVSLLRGFNSSGLHFLNFFNDPRIIREQRIAAYNGYRGGGVVQVLKGTSKGGVQAKNPDVGVYRSRLKCWICLSAAAAVWSKKKHMWPSILTMKRSKLLSQLLP